MWERNLFARKISRDADILIDDAANTSEIIEQVKTKVKKRKIGDVCRFVYDRAMPQDFLDFLEIGFRTGLRLNDILNLKKENIDLQKERIVGNAQKTNLSMDVALDKISLDILKRRLENTETNNLFADKFGNTYKPGYFGKYYEKAHKSMYPDLLIHKDIISIRRGNRDLLYTHDVSIAEIEYRQCFRSAYDDDLYVEDQSDSLYVIDTF